MNARELLGMGKHQDNVRKDDAITDPSELFKSRHGAGQCTKTGAAPSIELETEDGHVAVFYGAIAGVIRYTPGVIRFRFEERGGEMGVDYFDVEITGGEQLVHVFRDLAGMRLVTLFRTPGVVDSISVERAAA